MRHENNNKKIVLITGGAGFLGHHVIEHILKNTNWDIISLDRLDASGNLNRITDIGIYEQEKHRIKFVFHDLKAELNEFVAKKIGQFHIVLHLAAASHVDRSIFDPLSFAYDNVIGTVNLLNFIRTTNPNCRIIYFSTDEVFGPAAPGVFHKETDPYNSANPYSASKAGAEQFCVAFANTYKLNIQIIHCMNIFGERQHPEKFIPKVISKILKHEIIQIHADKTRTIPGSRFYIHARNVADGILFLLDNTSGVSGIAEHFNIVGEKEVDNLSLVKYIAKILNVEVQYELVDFHSSRPGHDLRYALDGTKMKNLGWELPQSFEESLKRTILWTLDRKNDWLLL